MRKSFDPLAAIAIVCGGSMLFCSVLAVWVGGAASFYSQAHEEVFGSDARTHWEQYAERLSQSKHVATDKIIRLPIYEAEHLFLGFEPWQKFPILLQRPLLHEHCYIVGRTGAGKTSMGLMQILIQTIRGHRTPDASGWCKATPVIIVDLKGDETLFHTAKKEAERRGQKFRFFTLEPNRATFRFNPFSGFRSATRTISQLVQLVLDTLSLYHGVGYGKGYYSQRSRFFLSHALAAKDHNSFGELYQTLRRLYGSNPQDFRDAFELLSVVESLTHYEQLVTTEQEDEDSEFDVIRMDRVLEDREIVYFWLPSAKESAAVATIGKLVMFNLQTAAQERKSDGKKKRQAFLMIDEFQKLAGENFQQILQQARSAGIAAVLANQSLSDLQTPDWDLGPTIRTNTRVKMYFSINEAEELKALGDSSGDELQVYGAEDSEALRPRLSVKELLALSDHPKRLLLHVSSGSGYTQYGGVPIPVETDWPISKALADERAELPWPSKPLLSSPLSKALAPVKGAKPQAARERKQLSPSPQPIPTETALAATSRATPGGAFVTLESAQAPLMISPVPASTPPNNAGTAKPKKAAPKNSPPQNAAKPELLPSVKAEYTKRIEQLMSE